MTQHHAEHTLLDEVEAFLGATGMGASYLGRKAVGNSEVVPRLRAGRDVTTRTAEELRKFMAEHSTARAAP